jgi:hypothetical protein
MTSTASNIATRWTRLGDIWKLTRNNRLLAVIEPAWSDHHCSLFMTDCAGELTAEPSGTAPLASASACSSGSRAPAQHQPQLKRPTNHRVHLVTFCDGISRTIRTESKVGAKVATVAAYVLLRPHPIWRPIAAKEHVTVPPVPSHPIMDEACLLTMPPALPPSSAFHGRHRWSI